MKMIHYSFIIEDYMFFFNTDSLIKEINQREKITTYHIFSTISTVIASLTQEVRLPILTNFQLIEDDKASTSNETLDYHIWKKKCGQY